MIAVVAVILGLALIPLAGRDLGSLRNYQFRGALLVPLALALQILASNAVLPGLLESRSLVVAGWLAGASLLVLACILNLRLHGMYMIAAGVCLNALVIALNAGMPVGPSAIEVVGDVAAAQAMLDRSYFYHAQGAGTRLAVLGDVLPIVGPSPLRSIVSLGDLLLVVGVVAAVFQAPDID